MEPENFTVSLIPSDEKRSTGRQRLPDQIKLSPHDFLWHALISIVAYWGLSCPPDPADA